MSDFRKIGLAPGIDLYIASTGKFKTNWIHVFIQQALSPENATRTAILPAVLRRGCEGIPTTLDLERALQGLYGAELGADAIKKGERHLIHLGLSLPNDKYLPQREGLFAKGFELLSRVLLHPLAGPNGFQERYVQQEKANLKRRIESLINDKSSYAAARCIQEMCKGEAFGVYKYGRIEDIDPIGPRDLMDYYSKLVRENPMDIFVVGDVHEGEVGEVANRLIRPERGTPVRLSSPGVHYPVGEVRQVFERQDVQQGKLCLGVRTQTARSDPDFHALEVANGILGGYPHSKLFQNVRERASLAYYAYSRLETLKGLMVIYSGIEVANFSRALEIIQQQIDDLMAGRIGDQEFDATKKALELDLKTEEDRPGLKILHYLEGVIGGVPESLEDHLGKMAAVQMEQVVAAARKVQLDTVYFLANREGN
ncbi:MAG: insulinase family protein [Firmicutes bacterium]|nr:insulinase family protein [Bacillota bacterium]